MISYKLFELIQENIDLVISGQPPIGTSLWQQLIKLHPADIAQLLSYLSDEDAVQIFDKLDKQLKLEVFKELNDSLKILCLSSVKESDRAHLLKNLSMSQLTDFLDQLSDEELNKYLKLLHEKNREQVISLLKFDPESAGGIMDTNVLTLQEDFTLEKSIQILQRLQPDKDLYQQIFVTDSQNKLVGSINLQDLVVKNPKTILKSILQPLVVTVLVNEDQEEVAKKMNHYSLTIAPVVEQNGIFLGVISSETLVDIVQEESSEDIYRMAAVVPIKGTYFDTSFLKLFYQRGLILFILVLVQTISSFVIESYQDFLMSFGLIAFLSMLTSTGGNSSSQTSALAIQGMATGEINETTKIRFIKREFLMALALGVFLGAVACFRIYLTDRIFNLRSFAIGASLSLIIIISMTLGSCMPLILKKFNADPAHSAGPVLTTLIDVIGIIVYCVVCKLILG
jgi:magnesium transporter